jgi:C-5 cytosine-specific DNA methylase
MRVSSFFAGIGGFDLGFERAGMHVVFQCEIDPFCQSASSSVARVTKPLIKFIPITKMYTRREVAIFIKIWNHYLYLYEAPRNAYSYLKASSKRGTAPTTNLDTLTKPLAMNA